MENQEQQSIDEKRAAAFEVSSLYGKSWSEIKAIIHRNMNNGLILEKISNDEKLKEYCQQQIKKFLNYELALTNKDSEALGTILLYGQLEADDLAKVNQRIGAKDYLSSDRFKDLTEDKDFMLFVENIPEIKEEMEIPATMGANIRRNERQKIIDYVRFMESGNRSREMIQNGNWKPLSSEFERFPKMPTALIMELHNRESDKQPNGERLKMMNRIMHYRFEDIINGRWRLGNEDEMKAIESFINENLGDPSKHPTAAQTLEVIKTFREKRTEQIKNKKEAAEILPIESLPKVITPIKKEKVEKANILIIDDGSFGEDEIPQKIVINPDEIAANKKEITAENDEPEVVSPVKGEAKEEAGIKAEIVEKTENTPTETPAAEEKFEDWRQETIEDWREWARQENKVVQTYKSANDKALSFKIFNSSEAKTKDDFEADVTYKSPNHLVLKGKDGNVPGDAVFAKIIATAKKQGSQISFGNIKSDEFKARLMLACLNEPEIEMLNAPQLKDLKNVPEELNKALKSKLHIKGKTDELKGKRQDMNHEEHDDNYQRQQNNQNYRNDDYNRNHGEGNRDGERPVYNRDRGDRGRDGERNGERRPRRQYTEEETAAYLQRKKNREAGLGN